MNFPDQSRYSLRGQALQSRLSSLRRQIDSLEAHIKADVDMKDQLETDLRNEEDPRRRANLSQAIDEIKINLHRHEEELEKLWVKQDEILLKNHINEEVNDRNKLEAVLQDEREARQINKINQPIEDADQHLQQHERERNDWQQRLHSLQEKIGSQVRISNNFGTYGNRLTKWLLLLLLFMVVPLTLLGGYLFNTASLKIAQANCNYQINSIELAQRVQAACSKVLQAEPTNINAFRNQGRALLLKWGEEGGNGDESTLNDAVNAFGYAVQHSERKDANALFHYGLALSLRHFVVNRDEYEIKPAQEAYQEAFNTYLDESTKVSQIDFVPMVEIGHYMIKRCEHSNAISIYSKVLDNDPDNYGALTSKIIALSEKTEREKALGKVPNYAELDEIFEKSVISSSTSPALKFNLGSVAARKDDFEQAAEYYDSAAGLSGGFFLEAWRNEGLALMIQGKNQVAFEHYDRAIQRIESKPDVNSSGSKYSILWFLRGLASLALGDYEKANQDFEETKVLGFDLDDFSKYTAYNAKSPTRDELRDILMRYTGFFSDHENFLETDPVVEVHHDALYPGAKCEVKTVDSP